MAGAKELFLSHAWKGSNGADTHAFVVKVGRIMQSRGWTVWIDEDDMVGNIEAAMASGIERCQAVLMFLTYEYISKVNNAAHTGQDNCWKEFNYAFWTGKQIVPIIMDPALLNPKTWEPGIVPMKLSMQLFVNGCASPQTVAERIHKRMLQLGLRPLRQTRPRLLSNRSVRAAIYL